MFYATAFSFLQYDVFLYEEKMYLPSSTFYRILDSIVVSIPACHAGDRGSIPRRGDILSNLKKYSSEVELIYATKLFHLRNNLINHAYTD